MLALCCSAVDVVQDSIAGCSTSSVKPVLCRHVSLLMLQVHHALHAVCAMTQHSWLFTLAEVLMPVEFNCICRSLYNAKSKHNPAEQVLYGELKCRHHQGGCTTREYEFFCS